MKVITCKPDWTSDTPHTEIDDYIWDIVDQVQGGVDNVVLHAPAGGMPRGYQEGNTIFKIADALRGVVNKMTYIDPNGKKIVVAHKGKACFKKAR